MFIVKSAVRKSFKLSRVRVPRGLVDELNNVICALVDAAKSDKISVKKIESICAGRPVLGRHVSAAVRLLAERGQSNQGLLVPTAQEIADKEQSKPRPAERGRSGSQKEMF